MGTSSSTNGIKCVVINNRSDTKYAKISYRIDDVYSGSTTFTKQITFDLSVGDVVIKCYDEKDNIVFTLSCEDPEDNRIIMNNFDVSMASLSMCTISYSEGVGASYGVASKE
jgi:hypothetical protein